LILNPFKYYSKKYKERNLNSKQLAKMMNMWPPSIANRIKVVQISEDYLKAKMIITQSWLNSAFDKIMFGGTTYSGMDMYYGMALPLILSTKGIEAYVFTKEANIKYLKAVKSNLTVIFELTEKQIDAYVNGINKNNKHEEWLTVKGYDTEDVLCAETKLLTYVRNWPRSKEYGT
jgi:acyl-coenzyme A thioesterase PaaI-like protein